MTKQLSLLISLLVVLTLGICRSTAGGDSSKTRLFTYVQDFETVDPFSLWTTNGEFTENFKGLTEEKVCAGKKSIKLDVTLKKGSYFYWRIPLKVPIEGKLKLSVHLLLGEGTTGTVGLGVNLLFPPTKYSGCSASTYFSSTDGYWKSIEYDLVDYAKGFPKDVIGRYIWGIADSDCGTTLDSIVLFVNGSEGKRVVVYLDDLQVKGEVPSDEDYQKEANDRWTIAKARLKEIVISWQRTVEKAEKELSSPGSLSANAEKIKSELLQRIAPLKEKLHLTIEQGYVTPEEHKEIEPALDQLKAGLPFMQSVLRSVSQTNGKDRGYLLYLVPPLSNVKILPQDLFVPGTLFDEIRLLACPDEYEPASFVISPFSDLTSLKVEASDLKKGNDLIPASQIDIKVVKCWYQGESAWEGINLANKKKKVLIPELLLNDDSLVKVDFEKKENYLKLSFPAGTQYVWISNPAENVTKMPSLDDFPVKDSTEFLPVDIPAHTNKQFWVTVKVPATAPPGIYKGALRLSTSGKPLESLQLRLRVLPFKLSPPYPISTIYYRSVLTRDGKGTISGEEKTEQQFRRELEDLLAHGVNNPQIFQRFDKDLLTRVLQIRKEVGMDNRTLFFVGRTTGNPATPEAMDSLRKDVTAMMEFTKTQGVQEVYFMGMDEASGEKLQSQKPAWTMVHELGGKIFCAGFVENFQVMGKLQDLLCRSGYPKRELADQGHSIGGKICSYGNPFGGVENPEVHRRNYGLLLWKLNYDGASNYAYQHYYGWNDFCDTMRGIEYVYPTTDGVIDTLAWEGYREGLDDVRYVRTLEAAIKRVKKLKVSPLKKIAFEAESYLSSLDVEHRNLDTLRLEIIDYLLKLETKQ